ncbi:MAG: hypothetical protein ACYDD6_02115 [Acidimicrobiales bacterium]
MGSRLGGWFHGSIERRQRRRLRWAIGTASAALTIAGATAFGHAANAGADQAPGQGSSYAQLLQITPHEGSLAVGAVFGEALAGHTNAFARAQSQGLDLGAVGQSMRGYNCGAPPNTNIYNAVPQPFQTETGAQGASQGLTQGPSQSDYGANEFVLANGVPYGEADTTFAGPLADPTNAFMVSGMRSKSWSGLVNGVNEAGASSDIASVDIGGVVVLDGLRWDVVYPTGAQPSTSFTIGNVVINGTALPPTPDLSALQSAINQVLGTLGLQVQLPTSSIEQGIEFVSPLQILVVPNAARDSVLDPAVSGLQPTYYQLANGLENGFSNDQQPLSNLGQVEATPPGQQIEAALCQSDTPITVADIAVASLDGGGYFSAALGGVNATSSLLAANQYDLAALGFGSLSVPGTSQYIPGASGTPPTAGVTGLAPTSTASSAPGTAQNSTQSSTAPTRTLSSARRLGRSPAGGPLLAAGLGGLGLMAFLAEADRRKMRRAQRTAIVEE